MAIVIKEASKTPLALGQLAETMANTYLQHNKMKNDFAIAEQDSIWKNKQQTAQLDASNALGAMDNSMFTMGEAGKKLAMANTINGKAVGDLLTNGGSNPEWMGKRDSFADVLVRTHGLDPQEAMDVATMNVLNTTKSAQDPMGMSRETYIPGIGAVTGTDPRVGAVDSGGDYTAMESSALGGVANNAQSMESASMTGSIPTVSNQADYDALPNGARYIGPDGQPRTKGL